MSQINFCSKCGQPLTNATANFCSNCGYKFVRIEELEVAPIEAAPIAPVVEIPQQEETNTTDQIKNLNFTKYGKLFGIMGTAISGIATIIIIHSFFQLWHYQTSFASLNRFIFGMDGSYMCSMSVDTFMTFVMIALALLSHYYLRRFADTQTTLEDTTHIRKMAFGVLLTIIGGILSFVSIVNIAATYEYHAINQASFFNLSGVAIIIYGVYHIIKHLNRYQHSSNISDNIRKYVKLVKILTFVILMILLTSMLMELINKFAWEIAITILCIVMTLAVFSIIGTISIFTIIAFNKKNTPTITEEQSNEIEARLAESKSSKHQLTSMLYVFAGITLIYTAQSFVMGLQNPEYNRHVLEGINFDELTNLGGFGCCLPLFVLATIFLIHKAPNQKRGAIVAIIMMTAGGFNLMWMQLIGISNPFADNALFMGISYIPLCVGYLLYVWFSKSDLISRIILTVLPFMPLFNGVIENLIPYDHNFLVGSVISINYIIFAAAYIYVIIRINGLQSVKAKWCELIK